MYATCLFCHGALGGNERVEHFPVGRRLAFDADRGRLWVICPKCRQWNLSPIEERWEAIEDCERLFRDTARRVSTDNIALARLGDGTELVRIGRPQRPEFAAWRYGEKFSRRRRVTMIQVGLGLGAIGAVIAGGAVAGIGIGSFGWMIARGVDTVVKGSPEKLIARMASPEGGTLDVRRKHLRHVQLLRDSENGWALGVPRPGARKLARRTGTFVEPLIRLSGNGAIRAAGRLLPHINRFGGTRDEVNQAVTYLEADPDPMRVFQGIVGGGGRRALAPAQPFGRETGHYLANLPEPMRLALEMAAHEDQERRALEGELAVLEEAWREAEEIAKIADDMFLPSWIQERVDRWRS